MMSQKQHWLLCDAFLLLFSVNSKLDCLSTISTSTFVQLMASVVWTHWAPHRLYLWWDVFLLWPSPDQSGSGLLRSLPAAPRAGKAVIQSHLLQSLHHSGGSLRSAAASGCGWCKARQSDSLSEGLCSVTWLDVVSLVNELDGRVFLFFFWGIGARWPLFHHWAARLQPLTSC